MQNFTISINPPHDKPSDFVAATSKNHFNDPQLKRKKGKTEGWCLRLQPLLPSVCLLTHIPPHMLACAYVCACTHTNKHAHAHTWTCVWPECVTVLQPAFFFFFTEPSLSSTEEVSEQAAN